MFIFMEKTFKSNWPIKGENWDIEFKVTRYAFYVNNKKYSFLSVWKRGINTIFNLKTLLVIIEYYEIQFQEFMMHYDNTQISEQSATKMDRSSFF